MRRRTTALILGFASLLGVSGGDTQVPLSGPSILAVQKKPLTGRFIHITDFHPDPHYKAGATFDSGCHRVPKKHKGKGKGKGKGKADADFEEDEDEDEEGNLREKKGKSKDDEEFAGRWGSGVSDCDSPMSLVNTTFDWLKKEWADEVDFVIWTGDNARHDIDRSLPRTPKEIFNLNRMMVDKMRETFPKDVVVVPSIGNNDIYPHNVLAPGPNTVTSEFLKIWKHFIPEDFRHVFERGAYYSVEVIPDRLAVISLNTLFWYDSNTLVDGCKDRSNDPGALHMDWLEVQLSEFRDRGMQVWMSGHVPPHMGHYFENCYLRYGDLALRYQDTIVGHLFGHMNIDHFFFIDVQELEASSNLMTSSSTSNTSSLHSSFAGPALRHGDHLKTSGRYKIKGRSGNNALQEELKKDFGEMPGPQNLKMKDYAVMNVAPSIIPTYLPGVRIYSYNISGVERGESDLPVEDWKKRKGGHRHDKPKDDCSKPENEDKPHCVFKTLPRYYDKNSPSRSNRPLTPLGYTQFYLPDVDTTSKEPPKWELEYTTFKPAKLFPNETDPVQPPPVPLRLLPGYSELVAQQKHGEQREDGEDMENFVKKLKKVTPWRMKDLTIGSYVKLARKLVAEKKMWNQFTEIMFVSS